MPSDKSRRQNEKNNGVPILKLVIIALLCGGFYFVLCGICAFVSLKVNAEQSFYIVFGFSAALISGFLCGRLCAGAVGHSGILYGSLGGAVQGTVCAAAVFFINGSAFGAGIAVLALVIVVFAALGGIAGVNRKKRIRY